MRTREKAKKNKAMLAQRNQTCCVQDVHTWVCTKKSKYVGKENKNKTQSDAPHIYIDNSHLDSALNALHLSQERHQQARLAAPGRPVHAHQLSRVNFQGHLS